MGKIGGKEAQRRALREGKAGLSAAGKTPPHNERPRSKTVSVGGEEVSPPIREIPVTAKESVPASGVADALGADLNGKFDRTSYQRNYMREYMRKRRAAMRGKPEG